MNRLSVEKRSRILHGHVEGLSIRSLERMTGHHRDTIMRVIVDAGNRCQVFLDENVRNFPSRYLQLDEIWTFVGKKTRRMTTVERERETDRGDQYIFVALDAETKFVPSFLVGKRNTETTIRFMRDLQGRLDGSRVQITTDGFGSYVEAIDAIYGRDEVDFAQIVKHFEQEPQDRGRYSPPRVSEVVPTIICGDPDPDRISTSLVERQNLTMRQNIRRFTRLTNAFSKKLDNLKAALAVHFYHYNFMRRHGTLRITPAMEAKLTSKFLGWEEVL